MNEELRLKYLRLYEDFSKKSTPDEIKYIASQIRPDLINNGDNSFQKKYEFENYKFNLKIDYKKGNKQPYFSNLDFSEFFINPYAIFDIPVYIQDSNIDIDYLLSIISHEVRHIYDIYDISSDYEVSEFIKSVQLKIFKDSAYKKFTDFIYLCLEHELIARHNMLYSMFRWLEITDKNELYQLYLKTYTYESLTQLENFNHISFINSFTEKDLIYYTNIFIKEVAKENNFCENKEDLINYYKKWSNFFKDKSVEYSNYVDDMLNDIISDIKENKIFENKTWEYNEYVINGTYKIFKEFYKQIFN